MSPLYTISTAKNRGVALRQHIFFFCRQAGRLMRKALKSQLTDDLLALTAFSLADTLSRARRGEKKSGTYYHTQVCSVKLCQRERWEQTEQKGIKLICAILGKSHNDCRCFLKSQGTNFILIGPPAACLTLSKCSFPEICRIYRQSFVCWSPIKTQVETYEGEIEGR